MLNDRPDRLGGYPFHRLTRLLSAIEPPAGLAPLVMSVGEPQLPVPALAIETLHRNDALWNKYPPMAGTPELREAIAGWLTRRYHMPATMIDPARHVAPLVGTREGLMQLALAVVPTQKNGKPPRVCLPNPFYHVYAGAAAYSGAELGLVPTSRSTGFLPDLDALDAKLLDQTALFYLCSPSNPQGTVADIAYFKRLIGLARAHDFVLAVDECYAEIYDGAAPIGALEACRELGGSLDHVVVLHSLSKRSSVPGLRSGFAAGDADVIKALLRVMDYGGGGMPLPVQATATALWQDEAHVEAVRQVYAENFRIAERILGNRLGFYRPAGGFFLWLDVGDGVEAAASLWREGAVRTLPGAYLAEDAPGGNPGAAYLRVALVHPPETTETGLRRLAQILS